MKNYDELLEQRIKEEYEREAKEEEAALLKDDSIIMPPGKKEDLYLKICEEIEKLEKAGKLETVEDMEKEEVEEEGKEKKATVEHAGKVENIGSVDRVDRIDGVNRVGRVDGAEGVTESERGEKIEKGQHEDLYANMSEEDRKALEIGRRVMEEAARMQKGGKVVHKKKRVRVYVGIAAALVLAMAVGVTSMGGPEKVIQMMTKMVGGREVEKVNSSEENLILVNEDEEEAYQRISEEFGIEPVSVMPVSESMKFVNMKLDEILQTAELYYEYNGKKLMYFISASYRKDSFAYEMADEVIDKYSMEVEGKEIEITKYQVTGEKTMRFSADFEELGLKYFLAGTMEQSEFELIVENLHFFS